MRRYKSVLLAIGVLGFCNQAHGAIVVQERAGYILHTDYEITLDSQITILNAIDERGAYWFECYDDSTEYPYAPAIIQWIYADPGVGTVEVKVGGYGDRYYGARDVWLIQIHQASGGGRLVELTISGSYGAVDQGDTLLADRAGHPQIAQIQQIQKCAHANLRDLRSQGFERRC